MTTNDRLRRDECVTVDGNGWEAMLGNGGNRKAVEADQLGAKGNLPSATHKHYLFAATNSPLRSLPPSLASSTCLDREA